MGKLPAIWVDGEPGRALPLPDRGLDFGDGLFETLLLCNGQPLYLDYHLQRLTAGLQLLGFPDTLALATEQLQRVCTTLGDIPWVAVRLTITRGAAPRGYAPPDDACPRVVITAAELLQDRRLFPAPSSLGWANIRWSSQPLLAGIKHLNRLEQVMAAREAQSMGCDEVVVLDQQGLVNSVSAGNLFLVSAGKLFTPVLETCGISGTRRRMIIEQWAPELGIELEQMHITPGQLAEADEVFYCNSLRGVQPVGRLGEHQWQAFPVCQALHRCYTDSLPC